MIAIIDLDSVCFSIGNPNKVLDVEGNPVKENGKFVYYDKTEDELRTSADRVMTSILTNCGCTHYIGLMKGRNTITTRKAINPDYKANRNQQEPRWWRFVQNDLFTRWGARYVNEIEVDDGVNITRLSLPNSFLVAIDGDLLGLEGRHYNWRKNVWVEVSNYEATTKFWKDMLVGQSVDNIKGIPRKGEVYFNKLLQKWLSHDKIQFPTLILQEYIDHFGEYKGITEYIKNYMSLKILDTFEHFQIPEPVEFKKNEINEMYQQ